MRRIITKERVKDIARDIPEEVDRKGLERAERTYLYFNGKYMFKWYEKGDKNIEYDMESLGLNQIGAYNKVNDNLFKRKNLYVLDRLLYEMINKNNKAKRLLIIRDLKHEKCKDINKKLRYLTINVDSIGLKTGLVVMSKGVDLLERSKVKRQFKGVTGYELEEQFTEELIPSIRYVLNKNSDKDKMVVWLLEKDFIYWGDLIEIVQEYDNYIHK